MKALPLVAGLLFATSAVADTPVLTVYAPDYFASEWGPGPGIEVGAVYLLQYLGRFDHGPRRPERQSHVDPAPIKFGACCSIEKK